MGFSYKSFRVYTVSVPIKGTIFCSSTKISWLSFEKLQIVYMYHPGKNMIMYLKYFAYQKIKICLVLENFRYIGWDKTCCVKGSIHCIATQKLRIWWKSSISFYFLYLENNLQNYCWSNPKYGKQAGLEALWGLFWDYLYNLNNDNVGLVGT